MSSLESTTRSAVGPFRTGPVPSSLSLCLRAQPRLPRAIINHRAHSHRLSRNRSAHTHLQSPSISHRRDERVHLHSSASHQIGQALSKPPVCITCIVLVAPSTGLQTRFSETISRSQLSAPPAALERVMNNDAAGALSCSDNLVQFPSAQGVMAALNN